jgi:hypothetical protein
VLGQIRQRDPSILAVGPAAGDAGRPADRPRQHLAGGLGITWPAPYVFGHAGELIVPVDGSWVVAEAYTDENGDFYWIIVDGSFFDTVEEARRFIDEGGIDYWPDGRPDTPMEQRGFGSFDPEPGGTP